MPSSLAPFEIEDQRTTPSPWGSYVRMPNEQDLLWFVPAPEPPSRPPLPDARIRYLAREIHALGERPLYELLAELVAGREIGPRLEAYARLPADFIRACGADRLPDLRGIDGGAP
jgi:hypothetical protein